MQLNFSNFKLNSVKARRGINIVKENKLEGAWGELEAKKCFQRQSFTKYLTQTFCFCERERTTEEVQFPFYRSFVLGAIELLRSHKSALLWTPLPLVRICLQRRAPPPL